MADAESMAIRRLRRYVVAIVLLGMMSCVVLGASLVGDPLLLAALKAAPNVPPVVDEGLETTVETPEPEAHPARMALDRNPIHDELNPDFRRLQRIDEASRDLKRDAVGFPDWMAALRSGAIKPRAGLSPIETMQTFDLNVIMTNTKEMPHVLFPHLSHTLWLDCSNCHPTPFVPKAGGNQVSMSEIFRGKYCGMCHDRVAFITFFACNRCHSVPQAAPTARKN
jgi:c(7)-type cytochrome triheme protein